MFYLMSYYHKSQHLHIQINATETMKVNINKHFLLDKKTRSILKNLTTYKYLPNQKLLERLIYQ